MHGNSTRENRETPSVPAVEEAAVRLEKAMSQESNMHAGGESDGCVLPSKCSNNGGQPPAEGMEGRQPTKENTGQATAPRTQSRTSELSGLLGVRRAARKDKRTRFTALLHHVTVNLLRDSYYALKREAAPGVDGVTWQEYETGLDEKLADLHGRIHRGTYRAQPSKRAYIPKADGRQRPLGIAALEDKVVQQAVVTVLNQIYEEDFLGISYGFRSGRSQHDALDALWVGIMRKKVNWILDADVSGFFDNLSHEWMVKFIEHRVADRRILRLIQKWLRAGVSEEGKWSKTEIGTPQGAVASPLLANIYLHYAFDLWVQHWRKHQAAGDVIVVRYADDIVVGFENRADAERFLQEWKERLQKFGLQLHPDKTRLIEFGRHAAENRKQRGEGKPEVFNFLGFSVLQKCTGKEVAWPN
jgi:group II intron reverse transcriptase/maturase